MPEQGLQWIPHKELLTYEEMLRICSLLTDMGIEKIRITGGEPFVRKGILEFLSSLSRLPKLKEISLTTNGLLTAPYVPELKKIGVRSVNLSLDTLDRSKFYSITRRDELHHVLETLDQLLYHNIQIKINTVIMDKVNSDDIFSLAELTKTLPISVRFIEEMPFNGAGNNFSGIIWNHNKIIEVLKDKFPSIRKVKDPAYSTASNYSITGHKGTIGIIAAYSRTFCGTCNRLRITPDGLIKTCLYDGGLMNIKDLLRKGSSDNNLQIALIDILNNRYKNGWEAEKQFITKGINRSMASIGG